MVPDTFFWRLPITKRSASDKMKLSKRWFCSRFSLNSRWFRSIHSDGVEYSMFEIWPQIPPTRENYMLIFLRDHIDREGRGSRCRLCKREGEIALGAFARAAEGGAAGCCSSSDRSPSPHYIRQWQLQHMVHLRPPILAFFEIDPGDGSQRFQRKRGFIDDMKYLKWCFLLFCEAASLQSCILKTQTSSREYDTIQHISNQKHGKMYYFRRFLLGIYTATELWKLVLLRKGRTSWTAGG